MASAESRLGRLTRLTSTDDDRPEDATLRGRIRGATPELASRLLLSAYFEGADDPGLQALVDRDAPQPLPNLRFQSSSATPLLQSESVSFRQRAQDVPIFGAKITVDIDEANRSLVAINGTVVPTPDGDPIAGLSAKAAVEALSSWGGLSSAGLKVSPPTLTWFLKENPKTPEQDGTWRLAFHFRSVPMEPPAAAHDHAAEPVFPDIPHFCLGQSPRSASTLHDYLVDAHGGEVLFYYRSQPLLDVPTQMHGDDSDGVRHTVHGRYAGNHFELFDPHRNIATYDYGHKDIDTVPQPEFPTAAISYPQNNLGNQFPAAISAHVNAQRVYDFFIDVLKRKSIDDHGMKIISAVNVYSSYGNPHEDDWVNAVWWQNKMWYGQRDGVSLARYLDVIAHELTHGVTSSTSDLIYQGLSGALNESYSDIFGVMIANWYPGEPKPIDTWIWEIGSGLGRNGGPIRDFANPASRGQPDNFSQYRPLAAHEDAGGVHIYSGIHNKAIYLLLTAVDENRDLTFPTMEAALLLYLTLTRLTPTSDFHDSRRTLESVTRTYYAGSPDKIQLRLDAIAKAFRQVGL